MTRVCLVGDDDVNLQYELLSRETSREALAAYDLHEPFENAVAVETVSLGAAVALLNDLEWYLVRFVDDALVYEPSISTEEWLSRELASAIRDGEVTADESDRLLKIYGLLAPEDGAVETTDEDGSRPVTGTEGSTAGDGDRDEAPPTGTDTPPRLVEPLFVARTGERLPEYDLRPVDGTVRVRVTEPEFEGDPT